MYTSDQLQKLEEGWFFYDHAWTVLHFIIKSVEGDTVLDVGAGTGLAASVVQSVFPFKKVVTLEPSNVGEVMGARRLDYVKGSVVSMPFSDNQFDFVYCSHVLEHVQTRLDALQELVRVAKRKVLIVVPEGDVDFKNFGSPHVVHYSRVSFRDELSDALEHNSKVKRINYSWIPHAHMNNLVASIEIN